LLINNPERPSKRHLLPFAIAFRDDPSTRPNKHRDRPSAFAIFSNHPSVAPHVHSLIVIHPRLTDRFLTIVDTLEATWRRIPVQASDARAMYVNRTLNADVQFALRIRDLMTLGLVGNRSLVRTEIRNVLDYSAKLGRRGNPDDLDLFTVLPVGSTTLTHSGVYSGVWTEPALDIDQEEEPGGITRLNRSNGHSGLQQCTAI
jgi:hypothetical protein